MILYLAALLIVAACFATITAALYWLFHTPTPAERLHTELAEIKKDLRVANLSYHEAARQGDFELVRHANTVREDLTEQLQETNRQIKLAKANPDWVMDRLREFENEANRE